MDQNLLTFVTVIEKESFTKAAEKLHLTQSAVSLKVKELERVYGIKLFERTNRFIRLTRGGDILYTHAKEILSQYDKASRMINDMYFKAQGPIHIGASYTYGEYVLPTTIAKFKEKYPDILPNISIRNSKRIIEQVVNQELDIGIFEGVKSNKNLNAKAFAESEMFIIVPIDHPLANKKEVTLKELEKETWILREDGSGTRKLTDQFFINGNISPTSTMEFGSSQIIKESVQRGLGISIMSEWLIQNKVNYNLIAALRVKDITIKLNLYYVTNDSQLRTKATDLFIEFLETNKLHV